MLTPATSPCISASTDEMALASNLSASRTATEPVIRLTEVWAYPVTTTWSNWFSSHSITIFTFSVLPGMSWYRTSFMPMDEKMTVLAEEGNVMLNRPSRSAVVPMVFFSRQTTPAPVTGTPSLSTTCPENLNPWA